MPLLSHLTSHTNTKSNLHLADSLDAAVSEPALSKLLTFQVPNLTSLFHCLCRTKVSVQVWGRGSCFVTVRNCQKLAQPPSRRTTPCRLSATAYSIHSQLPCISEAVSPAATWGRPIPRWLGPTYHGMKISTDQKARQLVSYVVYSIVFRQLPDMYSRYISSDIWNFSRDSINYCLLISGVFFADSSRFSAENGSAWKHWLGIYLMCKGYMLFSFGIFFLWENHWKGGGERKFHQYFRSQSGVA